MAKATVVAIGNTKTCGFCRSFDTLIKGSDFEARMPGAVFIWADQAKDAKLFEAWRVKAKASGNIPIIAVFDGNGALRGKFVARRSTLPAWSVAGIVDEIEKLFPDCCIDGGCDTDDGKPDDGDSPTACGSCTCGKCGFEIRYCPSCGHKL